MKFMKLAECLCKILYIVVKISVKIYSTRCRTSCCVSFSFQYRSSAVEKRVQASVLLALLKETKRTVCGYTAKTFSETISCLDLSMGKKAVMKVMNIGENGFNTSASYTDPNHCEITKTLPVKFIHPEHSTTKSITDNEIGKKLNNSVYDFKLPASIFVDWTTSEI